MIDAVNSVALSTPYLRGNADQVSTSDSFAVNPDRVQKAAEASYVSPYYDIDRETQALVYEVRDTSTGKALLKVSSRTSEPQPANTYDGSAQIRTASQTLSAPSNDTTSSQQVQTQHQETVTADQTTNFAAQSAAFANAAQAGNSNAGELSFDQIV